MTEIPTGDEYILDMIEEIDDLDLLKEIVSRASIRIANMVGDDKREKPTYRRGDIVFFTNGISPKYLFGKTATVVKVNDKSVLVNVPDEPQYRRFAGARNVRCPKGIVSTRPPV